MKNHIVRRSTVIVLGMLLASCSSTEQPAQMQPEAVQEQVDAETLVVQDAIDDVQVENGSAMSDFSSVPNGSEQARICIGELMRMTPRSN